MKKPNEIAEYLKKQSWYDEFVDNVSKWHKATPNKIKDILNGYKGELTIQLGFLWSAYSNPKYWQDIDDAFVEWYNS